MVQVAEYSALKACPFDEGRYCSNGTCRDCRIAFAAISKADRNLGMCQKCGVDRITVADMLRWSPRRAKAIIHGCPACQRYFSKEVK